MSGVGTLVSMQGEVLLLLLLKLGHPSVRGGSYIPGKTNGLSS
jgi:hypothetical protein